MFFECNELALALLRIEILLPSFLGIIRWQWNGIWIVKPFELQIFAKKGENLLIQFHFDIGSTVHCQVSQGNLQLTGAQKCIHL
jgi:hypothetical protein